MALVTTRWTSPTGSGGSSSAAAVTTGTVTPNVGDVMAVCVWNFTGTTANTAIAISQSAAGGATWNRIGTVQSLTNRQIGTAFWKVANGNDHGGTTITGTSSGGTGTETSLIVCDLFRTTGFGPALGADQVGAGVNTGAVTTGGCVALAAPSRPVNYADVLAWGALITNLSNGGASGVFNGEAIGLGMVAGVNSPDNSRLWTGWRGLCQEAPGFPTSATNWSFTYLTARQNIAFGACFYYDQSGGIIPVLLG